MDIFSHAVAGAASGAVFGKPIVGAIWGVVPDLVLGIKRLEKPTGLYRFTHSFLFIGLMGAATETIAHMGAVMLALLSHIVLDALTHGKLWAPRPFNPFSSRRIFNNCQEWEWGNLSWWMGLGWTATWSLLCLATATVIR